ncbi:DUF2442 domain-containing protein [Accumulibacter sp.]|uniref:DUF2442 domain-containing protein n=1 Tax=Accumulibacter sp. TaxID=2053492 RepID=UPI00338EA4F9
MSQHGLWILLREQELFLPYSEFPWFRNAVVGQIFEVQLPSPDHTYWPELDLDLAVESIRHTERFPLVSRIGA